MKRIVLSLFLLASLSGVCQEITVASEKNEESDFSTFHSYFWARQADGQLDDQKYFLSDLVLKADIRNAVQCEMGERGYFIDEWNPDILVNFRVFDRDVALHGIFGAGSSYWNEKEAVEENVNSRKITLKAGTLIISLLDRKGGRLVWQGFASGLIQNNEFIKDEGKIRNAVNKIFEEYAYRANKYTKR